MNGSAEEAAAAKVQPENASAAPKKNMGKKRGNWMPENMKLAVDEVRGGKLSIREASEKFCVPKSTLADRLKLISAGNETNMKPAMGTFKSTFSEEEDDALYNYIKMLDSHLMPLNKNEFLKLVFQYAEYLKLNHQFNKEKGMAGKKFYYSFMNRHPDLSLRLAESTNLKRAKHFNQEPVSEFFDKLTELMCKYSLDPARIYNVNEIEVSTLHENQPKVMSVKGNLNSGKRGKKITVLLCINASGDNFVPPLLVFPRVRMDNKLTKDAPMGTIFDAHPWGWITKNGFLKWMKSFVLRVNPSEDNPVLLIVDGHCAHKDLDVILFAQAHNVHMLSLPPHTSHKFQSLDRVIMKPFKTAYNEACSTWMRKYPNLKITLKDISGLISCAFTKVCRMELAQSAFSCFGIYPLNHNIFSDTDLFSSSTELLQTTSEDFSNTQHHQMKTSSEQQTSILCFSALPCTASPLTTKSEHSDSSNQNPSPSVSLIQKLNPLPNEAIQNLNLRKRRGDQNEILSSTPFKQSLGERKQTTILQESNKTTKHYAAKGEI